MSLSLSSLLNPTPASGSTSPANKDQEELQPPLPNQQQQQAAQSPSDTGAYAYPPSTLNDAARALASLSASPAPPPTHYYGYSAPDASSLERQRSGDSQRRASGYGDQRQLPPPPAGGSRKMSSPTLDQYHAVSRSPEQQRASIVSPAQSSFTLPPMQGYAAEPSRRPSYAPSQEVNTSSSAHASAMSPLQSEAADAARAPPQLLSALSTTSAIEEILPPAAIKEEAVPTPQPSSPVEPRSMEQHTVKAVASLKNEHGLRTQSPLRESSVPVPTTEVAAPEPQPGVSRKRPAPKTKKGTATTMKKAPPSKKRKVESKRSATPSSRASKPSTAGKGASLKDTPANSSPAPSNRSYSASPNEDQYDEDEEEGDEEGDRELYCLCRKTDSGTFMIGCDGTCDDWFHGKCVGIEERDKHLIDKYLCPTCTKSGIGRTTWKRICRRGGCHKPADMKGKPSKYCSSECGVLYFREMVARTRGREDPIANRSSRRKGSIDDGHVDSVDDLGARGGELAAGEVKALLNVSKTAEEFRKLGDGVLSPPATPDGDEEGGKTHIEYTEIEIKSLERIRNQKEEARRRHVLLKDRMKFVTLVKQSASRMATEKELKPKDYCGYDPRIEWTEDRFQAWRSSKSGQQAFEKDSLPVGGGEEARSGEDADSEVCDRKKCARHLEWAKLAVDDLRFEMSDNGDHMRALDKEEIEIKERATLRSKASGTQDGDGTVEVHGVTLGGSEDKIDVNIAPTVEIAGDAMVVDAS